MSGKEGKRLNERDAMRETARQMAIEQGSLNLLGIEGLITTAYNVQQLRRDLCALLAQQVNYDAVDMVIAEEAMKRKNSQSRFAEFPSEDNIPSFADTRGLARPERRVRMNRKEEIIDTDNKDLYDFSSGFRPGRLPSMRRFPG